jgi:MFS family permease
MTDRDQPQNASAGVLATPADPRRWKALGLIALLFRDPRERMKALGIWGGLAGLGETSGTVISGALTDLSSWRLIFFINLPVALIALLVVPRLVSESRMVREHDRPDIAGAVTGTAALIAVAPQSRIRIGDPERSTAGLAGCPAFDT